MYILRQILSPKRKLENDVIVITPQPALIEDTLLSLSECETLGMSPQTHLMNKRWFVSISD